MNRTMIIGISITLCMAFTSVSAMAHNKVVVVPLSGGAEGNAEKSDVLSGKTFSNSTSKGITGTRPPAPAAVTGATRSDYTGDDVSYAPTYGESASPRFSMYLDLTGGGRYDYQTGLSWEQAPSSTLYTWTGAIDRCEAKSTGSFWNPNIHTDWRLPNIKELLSIIDRGEINPALPSAAGFNLPSNNWFWTSTPYAVGTPSSIAWAVHMVNGAVNYQFKTLSFYAMCVRGGLSHAP